MAAMPHEENNEWSLDARSPVFMQTYDENILYFLHESLAK